MLKALASARYAILRLAYLLCSGPPLEVRMSRSGTSGLMQQFYPQHARGVFSNVTRCNRSASQCGPSSHLSVLTVFPRMCPNDNLVADGGGLSMPYSLHVAPCRTKTTVRSA